jgi:hypothetical protein
MDCERLTLMNTVKNRGTNVAMLVSAFCLLLMFVCISAYADVQSQSTILKQREAAVDHLTTTWQVEYHQHDLPLTTQQIQAGVKDMREQLPPQLKNQGITDPTLINTIITRQIENYRRVSREASYHSTTQWTLTRDGSRTLIEGVHQLINDQPSSSPDSSQSCRLFYDGSAGLFINDANQYGQTQERTDYSLAWESPGDSVYYAIPVPTTFSVPPGELAMLGGFSPLAMYGASWRVMGETNSVEELETHVDDIAGLPGNIKVQLSRDHGLAPARIEVDYIGTYSMHTIVYTTTSYKQYGNTWLCSRVQATDSMPNQMDNKYMFALASVSEATPITTVDNGNTVDDYRLLGPKLSIDVGMTPEQRKNVVMYPWPGHFLSIAEIKQIQAKRFPGEGSPDPDGPTSMLPAVGGLACLIGGILTYRRRGKHDA